MFDKARRDHWSVIFDSIIDALKNMGLVIIVSLFNIDEGGLFIIPFLIVIALIVALIRWVSKKFYLDGEGIVYTKGIIFKKRVEVPFNKINTIDITKNIIDEALKVATIKVDSGAVKEEGAEIKLKLTFDEATEIKKLILSLKKNVTENIDNEEYQSVSYDDIDDYKIIFERKITIKELVLYAVTKGKLLWAIGALFLAFQSAGEVDEAIQSSYIKNAVDFVGDNINGIAEKTYPMIAMMLIVGFIVIYVIINLLFIVYEIVRLYNFTVKSDGKNIYISYGLLSKKEYSLPINKIHALRFKQGLVQQWLKVFNLEAVTIGYGDEANENAIIYPIADEDFIKNIIGEILPSFKENIVINKPPKRALSRFIIKRTIIMAVFLSLTFLIYIGKYIEIRIVVSIAVLIINMILGFINYKNTSLGVSKNIIRGSEGSLLKTTTLIKQTSVQSINVIDGPFHRRKAVYDFEVDIYTNSLRDSIGIKGMDRSLEKELMDNLII